MPRLTEPALKQALDEVLRLLELRKNGTLSEDEIAKKMGFESALGISPARRMYTRLENLGLPEWLVYPEAPKAKGEKRKARTFGQAKVDLPDAAQAERLFRGDLKRLTWYADDLDYLREQLRQDPERWVSYIWVEDEESYHRVNYSEEQWRRLCEEHNVDPARESFVIELAPASSPRGMGPTPWEGLVYLIAMHMLMGGSIDAMLEALHPNPDQVDREELREMLYKDKHGYLTALKSSAEALAEVVRGGEVTSGRRDRVSRQEMWVAWNLIQPLADKGLSNRQILRKLGEDPALEVANKALGEKLTTKEIGRLKLLPRPPSY